MNNLYLNPFSHQTESIYKLLLKNNNPLDAKSIGSKLSISAHTVYRAVKPLVGLGLVARLDVYPTQFAVTNFSNALDAYQLSVRENFLGKFFPQDVIGNNREPDSPLDISFIKDRQELLERSNQDMRLAKKEVNLIVSGLEVPAETILEYKQAVDRGVRIRTLVQRLDEVNKEMLQNWRKIGIDVRFFSLLEARIIIFDSEIVYLTSYNPDEQNEGIGMRFKYPPIARIMSQVFEERWGRSSELK